MTELRDYLDFIRPWTDQSHKIVMATWDKLDDKGVKAKLQRSALDIDEIERMISYYAGRGQDVWFATQSYGTNYGITAIGQSGKWFKGAWRKQQNVQLLHNFYCDLDVKPGAYADLNDAMVAIYAFCTKIGMPVPSLMVCSGYGLHCYWRIEEDMTPQQWQPVAQGLRHAMEKEGIPADHSCTIDSVRVLRPPGTYNFKNPANPVVTYIIPGCTRAVHKLEQISTPLLPFMGPHLATVGGKQVGPVGKITSNLSAGLDESQPVSLHEIASQCAVIEHEFATNGATASQPMWSLIALASAFDINPWDTFQELSDGYPSYDPALARQKLDEKILAKGTGTGWPSCKVFAVESKLCQTCPHFSAGKSPLHLKLKPIVDPTTLPGGEAPNLPPGYYQMPDGRVYFTQTDKNGNATPIQVAIWAIGKGEIDEATDELVFRCRLGNQERTMRTGKTRSHDIRTGLYLQGFITPEDDHKKLGEFIVTWMSHLHDTNAKTMQSSKLGWDKDGNFTHGETKWVAGVATPAVYRDKSGIQKYMPVGSIGPWRKLMDFTTSCNNPSIEVLAAVGFAAPLMDLVAAGSAMLSPYSRDSSAGKTTSLRLTQAIWGNPTKAMFSVADSPKSVDKALGDVNNLPIIWDEIRTKETLEAVVKQAFQLTQNRSRNVLNQDRSASDGNTFKTILVTSSNRSLAEMITSATSETDAGALRIFEIKMSQSYSKAALDTRVMQMDNALNNNYGHAGAVYAAFLSRNRDRIAKDVIAFNDMLTAKAGGKGGERFWVPLITSILKGAQYANECDLASFNLKSMLDYLIDQLNVMRTYRDEETQPIHRLETMEELMQAVLSSGEVIFTNLIAKQNQSVQLTNHQSIEDIKRIKYVLAQFATGPDIIRLPWRAFYYWLRGRGQSPKEVKEELINTYGAVIIQGVIGEGIAGFSGMGKIRQRCLQVHLNRITNAHLP